MLNALLLTFPHLGTFLKYLTAPHPLHVTLKKTNPSLLLPLPSPCAAKEVPQTKASDMQLLCDMSQGPALHGGAWRTSTLQRHYVSSGKMDGKGASH